MNHKPLILASASPRRKELLEALGLQFEVRAVDLEESIDPSLEHKEMVKTLAARQANSLIQTTTTKACIIAADTLVVKGGNVYGKPKDRNEAISFLTELSGDVHEVMTGVCIFFGQQQKTFAETTRVHFNKIPHSEIEHYVDNHQVLDKAGAYAIQEWIGLAYIGKIEGCYFNVVGLPASRVYEELKAMGGVW